MPIGKSRKLLHCCISKQIWKSPSKNKDTLSLGFIFNSADKLKDLQKTEKGSRSCREPYCAQVRCYNTTINLYTTVNKNIFIKISQTSKNTLTRKVSANRLFSQNLENVFVLHYRYLKLPVARQKYLTYINIRHKYELKTERHVLEITSTRDIDSQLYIIL